MEDLLDGPGEEAGQRDRQRQRWGVAAGLDGVDGLAGDAHRLGELALGQAVAVKSAFQIEGGGTGTQPAILEVDPPTIWRPPAETS
jgi:hypothetical protein